MILEMFFLLSAFGKGGNESRVISTVGFTCGGKVPCSSRCISVGQLASIGQSWGERGCQLFKKKKS